MGSPRRAAGPPVIKRARTVRGVSRRTARVVTLANAMVNGAAEGRRSQGSRPVLDRIGQLAIRPSTGPKTQARAAGASSSPWPPADIPNALAKLFSHSSRGDEAEAFVERRWPYPPSPTSEHAALYLAVQMSDSW